MKYIYLSVEDRTKWLVIKERKKYRIICIGIVYCSILLINAVKTKFECKREKQTTDRKVSKQQQR